MLLPFVEIGVIKARLSRQIGNTPIKEREREGEREAEYNNYYFLLVVGNLSFAKYFGKFILFLLLVV